MLHVQVELVLTDGHGPDGFNQSVAGIPGVNNQTGLPKSPPGRCFPVEDKETLSPSSEPQIHNDSMRQKRYIL